MDLLEIGVEAPIVSNLKTEAFFSPELSIVPH